MHWLQQHTIYPDMPRTKRTGDAVIPPLPHPPTAAHPTPSTDGGALPLPRRTPHSAGLRRDMEVLKELASEECLRRSGLGVVRIAERLGREKSQVSRALRALEAEDIVERDPRTRTYQLGWGLYALAARGVETRLVRAAAAHLHQLAEDQRAEVQLCVLIGGQVLTLISVPPRADIRSEPAIQTPAGPVLALDWSDRALRDLVPADDENSLAYDSLLASCAHATAHGYVHYPATDLEPARYAAAVRDFRGVVLAAIQLVERAGEQTPLTGLPVEQAVVHAARDLSADLGFER